MSSDPNESITPTPRERELMMLIARGMQNKNIAYELKISENTVRAHIGNVMRKYRLHNRTQIAIIFALEAATPSLRCAMLNAGDYSGPTLEPTSLTVWTKANRRSLPMKRASTS
ncbi:transcriptional regulatory protein LiaR [mine drainage metagenome]|uniref:Transcriptional regulatory protein LiaR n=1 Tax=mine drainage metagenome TaxID=410659 RepID=A0A1J5PX45_9ZZZZ